MCVGVHLLGSCWFLGSCWVSVGCWVPFGFSCGLLELFFGHRGPLIGFLFVIGFLLGFSGSVGSHRLSMGHGGPPFISSPPKYPLRAPEPSEEPEAEWEASERERLRDLEERDAFAERARREHRIMHIGKGDDLSGEGREQHAAVPTESQRFQNRLEHVFLYSQSYSTKAKQRRPPRRMVYRTPKYTQIGTTRGEEESLRQSARPRLLRMPWYPGMCWKQGRMRG